MVDPRLRIVRMECKDAASWYVIDLDDPFALSVPKRIDFVAKSNGVHFALEIKWARNTAPKVELDIVKLQHFRSEHTRAFGYLCIFGRKSFLTKLRLPRADLREQGTAVYAEFGVTKYGCRIFEVRKRRG
jgi:hypothetical protein